MSVNEKTIIETQSGCATRLLPAESFQAIQTYLLAQATPGCVCSTVQEVLGAWMENEPLQMPTTATQTLCEGCNAIRRAFLNVVTPELRMEISAGLVQGDPLCLVLNLLLDQPLTERTQ